MRMDITVSDTIHSANKALDPNLVTFAGKSEDWKARCAARISVHMIVGP